MNCPFSHFSRRDARDDHQRVPRRHPHHPILLTLHDHHGHHHHHHQILPVSIRVDRTHNTLYYHSLDLVSYYPSDPHPPSRSESRSLPPASYLLDSRMGIPPSPRRAKSSSILSAKESGTDGNMSGADNEMIDGEKSNAIVAGQKHGRDDEIMGALRWWQSKPVVCMFNLQVIISCPPHIPTFSSALLACNIPPDLTSLPDSSPARPTQRPSKSDTIKKRKSTGDSDKENANEVGGSSKKVKKDQVKGEWC